jgi:hypothetical protein
LNVVYVLQWFSSVSDVCFKCFIFLQTNVANVSSGCFESRSGVAHVAMAPVAANSGLPQGFSSYLAPSSHGAPRRLLSLPSLPFPPSRCGSSSSTENPTRRVRKRQRRWWPRVSRWRRDAHVVASEQAEVCAIRSLRMGNKQPWVSVWTSGR